MTKKISELPLLTLPALTDQFEVNQGGVSKRAPLSLVRGPVLYVPPSGSDDTANIQAALTAAGAFAGAGATVQLGPYNYKISGNPALVWPDLAGNNYYGGVSLLGDSRKTTGLQWYGPNSALPPQTSTDISIALKIMGQTRCRIGNFTVQNYSSAPAISIPGNSVGVYLSGDSPTAGTVTGQLDFEPMECSGFYRGVQIGDDFGQGVQHAGSEITFRHLAFGNCTTGLITYDYNTISIDIYFIECVSCGIGVNTQQAQSVNIWGGSTANSVIADFFFNGPGAFLLEGVRGENTYAFTNGSGNLTVVGCEWTPNPSLYGGNICDTKGGTTTLIGSRMGGKCVVNNGTGITMLGCHIWDTAQPFRPYGTNYAYGASPPAGTMTLNGVQYSVLGCYSVDAGLNWAAYSQMQGIGQFDNTLVGTDLVYPTGFQRVRLAQANPTAAELTSGSNAKDRLAGPYLKNGKMVFAYNNAGTVTYLSIPLDGSTTTWTHSTSAP